MDRKREKFLIIRLGAIGDIVHCLPVANFLRENFEGAQIDWVVDEKCAQLLENNPLVDNVYKVPLSKWKLNWFSKENIKEIFAFNKNLQKQKYTWAFDLHGMFKSLVIFAFCGAKKRVSYRDYREFATLGANVLVKPKSKRPHSNYHIMQRNLDLVLNSGLLKNKVEAKISLKLPPITIGAAEKISNLLINTDVNKPIVVFAPATTWVNKHWNVLEWQKLFNMAKGEVNVVFTGTEADLGLIYEITQNDIRATILAGKTNLEEYIEVLRRADAVISPDSSASHLAFGLQCENKKPKIITIFTATSKHTYAPIGEGNIAFPLNEPACSPCFKRKCPKNHQMCTGAIEANEVFEKLNSLLLLTKY